MSDPNRLDPLIRKLEQLRADLVRLEADSEDFLVGISEAYSASARNLLHYIALRRHDIRHLQEELAALGLSSLGRAESCVLANVDAVLRALCLLAQRPAMDSLPDAAIDFARGNALLKQHTQSLLGPPNDPRRVRIMVTMPGEAAKDYALVRDLLARGMDCLRINCAHDDPQTWSRILKHLHTAETELGKKCCVLMDIGGPKLRTGELEPGPQVVKCRPKRDQLGNVMTPARVWLTSADAPTPPPGEAAASVPLAAEWLGQLQVNDRLGFRDTRGSAREMRIVERVGAGCWAELQRTAYLSAGTELRLKRLGKGTTIGQLPALVVPLILSKGDTLRLTREPLPGQPAQTDADGKLVAPAHIACTLPEVFGDLRPGERIFFDDGKIGGIIRDVSGDEVVVEITRARAAGGKLLADKGINLPDSALRLPALTSQDLEDLVFVASHADMVGMSFVHTAADVTDLQRQLANHGAEHVGIILKIETQRAFEELPELLLVALRRPRVGVMIARGDLAVECGYERLAELQEEILWICEAAHVPVIWATQVLEQLAKEGLPSRAEITDAAMGVRAECVMLNKGPHIVQAVAALDDILRRMEAHQSKKRSMLRQLKLADQFDANEDE